MAAADEVSGDWPAALAGVRAARDVVLRSMAGSACAAARTYARAVQEWVDGLPEVGGTRASLQQPQPVTSAGARLPTSPPERRQVRTAFTEAVRRARSLVPAPPAPRGSKPLALPIPVSTACTLSSQVCGRPARPRRPCGLWGALPHLGVVWVAGLRRPRARLPERRPQRAPAGAPAVGEGGGSGGASGVARGGGGHLCRRASAVGGEGLPHSRRSGGAGAECDGRVAARRSRRGAVVRAPGGEGGGLLPGRVNWCQGGGGSDRQAPSPPPHSRSVRLSGQRREGGCGVCGAGVAPPLPPPSIWVCSR